MPDRLETVAIAYSQAEIATLHSYLDGHGVRTFLHSFTQVGTQWGMTLALGGVRLEVRAEDAPAARALLARIDSRPFTGRLFTGNFFVDLLLALVLLAFAGAAPPARLPATFLPGPAGAALRTE